MKNDSTRGYSLAALFVLTAAVAALLAPFNWVRDGAAKSGHWWDSPFAIAGVVIGGTVGICLGLSRSRKLASCCIATPMGSFVGGMAGFLTELGAPFASTAGGAAVVLLLGIAAGAVARRARSKSTNEGFPVSRDP